MQTFPPKNDLSVKKIQRVGIQVAAFSMLFLVSNRGMAEVKWLDTLEPAEAMVTYLGDSIDIDRNVIAVGALSSEKGGGLFGDPEGDSVYAGNVHIYRTANGVKWNFEQLLVPDLDKDEVYFGSSSSFPGDGVSISGDNLVVQYQTLVGSLESPMDLIPSVTVFHRNSATNKWERDDLGDIGDGQHVYCADVSGDRIVLGYQANTFRAKVFIRNAFTGSWVLEQTLFPQGDLGVGSATSVAIRGDKLLVASGPDGIPVPPLAVHLFERIGANGMWVETQKFEDPAEGFGSSVALGDQAIAVGASRHSPALNLIFCGLVVTYKLEAGTWVQNDVILPEFPKANLQFGDDVNFNEAGTLLSIYDTKQANVYYPCNSHWQRFGTNLPSGVMALSGMTLALANQALQPNGGAEVFRVDPDACLTLSRINVDLHVFELFIPWCDITPGGVGGPWTAVQRIATKILPDNSLRVYVAKSEEALKILQNSKTNSVPLDQALPIGKLIAEPKNGTARIERSTVTYVPNPGFQGIDRVVFQTAESGDASHEVDLTIEIAKDAQAAEK